MIFQIIKGGTQTGVMKLVGEGMAKYYQKDNIKLLGIASWECGMFKEELVIFFLIFLIYIENLIYIFQFYSKIFKS